MLEELADVTAMPRHPLTEDRSFRLPVGASIERDHPISGRDERVCTQRPCRRRGGVAVDQDNRTPPALLDIAEVHSVTGAKRGHKSPHVERSRLFDHTAQAAVMPSLSCVNWTDGCAPGPSRGRSIIDPGKARAIGWLHAPVRIPAWHERPSGLN
jgi:hypothetical protein